MSEGLKLHHSNACPACGESGSLWPGQGRCDVCTGTFRGGQRVRYNHRLGRLHALTDQESCDAIMMAYDLPDDRDPGVVYAKEIEEHNATHLRFEYDEDQLPWEYKTRGCTNLHTILKRDDPGLAHASAWKPPPLGPGHPEFEDVLDVIREHGSARVLEAVAEAKLDAARERSREAWKRVRPALKKLIELSRSADEE